MKPPYHPDHPERVTFASSEDSVHIVAHCGKHFTGELHALGVPGVAREIAAELNAHRATYAANLDGK
jgi:hypothetical protein